MSEPVPVVFVHGLWLHASSWDKWVALFGEHGYHPLAPGWPGDAETPVQTRAHPGALNGKGITEVTDHFAAFIAELAATPIVIGHSFGGLIAQKLLAMGFVRGAVVLAPAQFKGIVSLPFAQLRTAFPVLSRPDRLHQTWSHTAQTFADGFANAVPRAESDEIFQRYAIPAPTRPLFQAAFANVTLHSAAGVDVRATRGPLLLLAAGEDRTVPESTVAAAFRAQRKNPAVTEYRALPGRSHSFGVDNGWTEPADLALDFLARNGLGPH